jgi:hypothetical protein
MGAKPSKGRKNNARRKVSRPDVAYAQPRAPVDGVLDARFPLLIGVLMIVSATPAEATAVLAAMWMVASAENTLPLSAADARGITSASDTVFGHPGTVDVDALPAISPPQLATAVARKDLRLNTIRLLAVMALDDGVIEDTKPALVGRYAAALEVHADFVTAIAAGRGFR